MQPQMPAGRSCRTSIPGDKLLCHLSLVSGAYNFFSSTSFNSSLPSISSASIRFEPGVLPLEFLELLGLIELKHPQLSLPPVVGLLTNLPLSPYVLYRLTSALRLPEDANLSFCCISFSFHFLGPF